MRIGEPKSCGAASANKQQAATITNEINTVELCIFLAANDGLLGTKIKKTKHSIDSRPN